MTVATRTLTVQVPVALAEELDALADLLERPPQWIVKKALIAYLTREKETRRLIQEGLDDVTAGRMVSMEDAQAWADSLGTENERAVPCALCLCRHADADCAAGRVRYPTGPLYVHLRLTQASNGRSLPVISGLHPAFC